MSQISYPFTGGARHSPTSAELRFGKPINGIVMGWTNIEYSGKLEPEVLRANHPDPIGYTIGSATYEASIEVYLAEFYQQLIAGMGKGWAVTPVDMTVTYSENGFDTVIDTIIGARFTGFEATIGNDAAGLKRKIPMKVLKIFTNQTDMLLVPLTGVGT